MSSDNTPKRCAFLSTDNLEGFFVYDQMLIAPLAEKKWLAEEVSWRNSAVDWNDYDVVVVRSTWDYQDDPQAFIRCLEGIESSSATLDNSLALINWNIDKGYLKELEGKGVTIVPTQWYSAFDFNSVIKGFAHFDTDTLIIKPTISANADDTFKLSIDELNQQKSLLEVTFKNRDFMVQPFLKKVVEEGEYSLFYFNGHYSHTILKVPKKDDFRVQEEHGGELHSVEPTESLKEAAQCALQALPEIPLYARLDFVSADQGFAIMEIELIEPSLYFNMDPESPKRFATAFVERYPEN